MYACREADLLVGEGEFVGILGPSGSGKSSLLYLLSGLKRPTEGRVVYENRALHERTEPELAKLRLRDFGFVFQHPFLVGYVTALENVVLAAPDQDRSPEARDLLEVLGLGSKLHRLPHELSGGERQRVCVARALLGGKRAIFADEPTANLDHATGQQVVQLLNKHRGSGSLILVTHDPTMLDHADRIVHMQDGRIAEADYS